MVILATFPKPAKKKKCTILYVETKKVEYIEAECKMVVTRGREVGELGDSVQRVQSCSDVR